MDMQWGILDYCFYALLGMLIVFAVLIFLEIVIWLMSKFEFGGKKEQKEAAGAQAPAAAASPALAPGTAGELKLYDTNPRDAAMIMAIVADELGKPLNELRFISIREVQR